jgi:hypothetical protein
LLDSSLVSFNEIKTLAVWREIGNELPDILAERIGKEWIDLLMIPEITDTAENPITFAQEHNDLLLLKAQEKFGNLQTNKELHEASVLMISIALHLSRGLGADTKGIAEHWIETAKSHGAIE